LFDETVTVELLTVEPSIASLNVNTICAFTETAVAPFAGLTLTTDGFVVSDVPDALVVNVLVNGVTTFPAWSVKPLTVIVYAVLTARELVGAKVSVLRSLLKLIAPATAFPPAETTTALLVTLAALTGELNTTST
jgi:hypothetical protein